MTYQRKKYPYTCLHCGETFLAYNKGVATQRYCDRKCASESQKTGEKYSCETCGKEVVRTKSNIKNKIYCSKECTDEGKKGVSVNTVEKMKKPCEVCGEIMLLSPCFVEERRVCSTNCRDKLLSLMGTIKVECTNCHKKFDRKKSRIRGEMNFCTEECMTEHYRESDLFKGENHPSFLGGNKKYYGPNWQNQRRKALKRDNHSCKECGMTEEEHLKLHGCSLTVHHKKPFRFHETYKEANRLNNLESLCKVCHGKKHVGDLHPSKYGEKVKDVKRK